MVRTLALICWMVPWLAVGQGITYHPYKMDCSPQDPFPYYTDGRLQNPAGLPLTSVQAATVAAFKTWEDVPCAYTAFKALGTNTSGIPDPRDPSDGYSVSTLWITSNTDPYYMGPEVAAHTIPLHYGGVLFQCDIYMNAVDQRWSTATPTPQGVHDVQSLVLHEAGHCQGINHYLSDINEVMDAVAPIGVSRRVLGPTDQRALCDRYPQAGAVGSPCSVDGGCGGDGGLTCVRAPASDGGTRAPMCTVGCPAGSTDTCPMGFRCQSSNLVPGSSAACLPVGPVLQTAVGRACGDSTECGSAQGVCQVEVTFPSGGQGWRGGYCTQQCGGTQPDCPAGAQCIPLGNAAVCLRECSIGAGDCRPGYTCSFVGSGVRPVCVPVCFGDVDCNPPGESGSVCRTCDGACLDRQNPVGQIGDPCTASSACGAGQVCGKFSSPSASNGVCTQPCGLACSACPDGTSCHSVGLSGELYCLRNCVIGSCPAGLQCGQLASGQGCIPACSSDLDCPVGTRCWSGQCLSPSQLSDGGCALCPSDAGSPPEDVTRDGGVLPSRTGGGCGCDTAAGSSWLALAALGMLRLRRAARRGVGCSLRPRAVGAKMVSQGGRRAR